GKGGGRALSVLTGWETDHVGKVKARGDRGRAQPRCGPLGQSVARIQGSIVNMTTSPEAIPRVAMKPMVCMPLWLTKQRPRNPKALLSVPVSTADPVVW